MSYSFPYPKDPSDVIEYKFDFAPLTNGVTDAASDYLAALETISTRTVTVGSGITKDSDSITNSNTSVTVWLSGGTAGNNYTVTCKIVTSASRTIEKSAIVRVREN
jgi:hypothetical protein